MGCRPNSRLSNMNAPHETIISSTADFCRNFPKSPSIKVTRDSLLEHISHTLDSSSRVVYLEGDSLTGKSELLAEYMRRNPLNSLGVFLSAGDNYFYTADYVRLVLSEQIHWLIHSVQANFEFVDEASFARLLLQLQKRARQNPITFVIDGLGDAPAINANATSEILKVFPFSQSEFSFVLSGSSSLFSKLPLERYKPKPIPLLPVGLEEAKTYFANCSDLADDEISQIRHFCRGTIGQMARFKELLQSGVAISSLLDEKEGTLKKLLDFEWELVPDDQRLASILGYVAFSTLPIDLERLGHLTGAEGVELLEMVARCRFVEIDNATGLVSIRSDAEKRFVRGKLQHLKGKIHEDFISDLLKNPGSEEAIRDLPSQLLSAGRNGDLIERLDDAHFVRLLETEKSLRSLKGHTAIGLQAARILRNDAAEARFALASSVITGLTFSVGTKSEIEARLRLGEKDCAIALALTAPTSEERLQLLAAAARAYHAANLLVPVEVKEQIRHFVSEVDFGSLGYIAGDIACDLLVVDFSLAMEVFERATIETKPRRTDAGIASTEESPASREVDRGGEEKDFGKVHSRLSEYHRQRFADAVASIVERSSSERLLARLKNLESKHQLFILKQWLKKQKKSSEAGRVAEYALDIALNDLTRSPRVEDFREIGVALPHLLDQDLAEKLVKRIKVQLGTQLSHGTTVESVRLEMLLIRTRYAQHTQECELELIELFSKIHQISEVNTKATCWAWMLYGLQKFPDPAILEGRTSVVSEITEKLIESIEELLESSADHYETARSAIYALARANPTLALQLVAKLNTQKRRDKAFSTLATELTSSKTYTTAPGLLLQCVSKIESEDERDETLSKCLSLIAQHAESEQVGTCNTGILALWRAIRIANRRFSAAVSTYRILKAIKADAEIVGALEAEIQGLWPDILVDWVRTDFGFRLVRDIASVDRQLALTWLERVSRDRQQSKIPSSSLSTALYLTIKLAIASFSIQADDSCDIDAPQLSRLAFLINSIPVPEHRMILWCDLGVSLHFKGKRSVAKVICTEFVQPVLHGMYKNNELVRDLLIELAAPFLYLTHPPSASIFIEQIKDAQHREIARSDICKTIFRKRSIHDPYKASDTPGYELDAEDIASVLDVLRSMHTDASILAVIEDLCASLSSKKNSAKIRRTQVRDYLNSIDEIIDKKLPDPRNIKHEGYKIAAKAHVLRARATFETVSTGEWQDLFRASQAIANVADRVVVTTMVGGCARGRGPFSDSKWFNAVKADIPRIPSYSDRIDRYSWVAELMESIDKQQTVSLLKDAMSLSNHLAAESSGLEKQKRILDLAHSVDPTLVDRIIDLVDRDEARAPVKEVHLSQIKLKEARKDLAKNPSCIDLDKINAEELAEVCFHNFGSLIGGRILPRPVEEFEKLATVASQLSISHAYPIWAWIIENASKKIGHRSKGERLIEIVYDAACHAAELTLSLIGKSNASASTRSGEDVSGLIRPGERGAIFERIRTFASGQDGKLIRISDPYFGPDDLDILHCLAEAAPNSTVRILTSKKHLRDVISDGMFDDAFRSAWQELCEIPPPKTEIVVIALGNDGGHPIHDRWIVSDTEGLRLGGSPNSMGYTRVSEVSFMDTAASQEKCQVIDDLLNRQKREWFGEKLQATSFFLD